MEQKLKKLFDYQRFERSPRLERLIRETENLRKTELTEDELSEVSAAGGEPFAKLQENKKRPEDFFGNRT